MPVEAVLYARLTGHAGLSALISNRVYPNVAPQNVTVPFVTYGLVSAVRESGFGEDIGIVTSRFQFDAYAATASSAEEVASQLRLALQRYRDSESSPVICDTFIINQYGSWTAEPALLHRAATDISIIYRE